MKAFTATTYGPPDVLKLRDAKKPVPRDDEVLTRVRAATVTSGSARLRSLTIPTGFK